MLGSLLGSLASVVSSTTSSDSTSSTDPSPPQTPDPAPAPASCPTTDIEDDPFLRSAYFQRLLKRGEHDSSRVQAIKDAALADEPPQEPGPWECCNEGCGIECVVTIWWEEEKTWRDMHPGWSSIKQRLKEEEEDRRREAEEEAALNGTDGGSAPESDEGSPVTSAEEGAPRVKIGIEPSREEHDTDGATAASIDRRRALVEQEVERGLEKVEL